MVTMSSSLSSLAGVARTGILDRALASAATVGGVLAELPCRFHVVSAAGGQWALVTCPPSPDPAHAMYVHERSLTAVQRFTLSLWSEGIGAVWEPAPLVEETALEIDLGRDVLIGRVWCPALL